MLLSEHLSRLIVVAWLRPNFNFSFFPAQDSARLPAVASQQIAFAFGKREKLRLSDRKNSLKIVSQFRLTNDKRFAFALPNFSIYLGGS